MQKTSQKLANVDTFMKDNSTKDLEIMKFKR